MCGIKRWAPFRVFGYIPIGLMVTLKGVPLLNIILCRRKVCRLANISVPPLICRHINMHMYSNTFVLTVYMQSSFGFPDMVQELGSI